MATTDGCNGGGTGTAATSARLGARAHVAGLRAVDARLGLHTEDLKGFPEIGVGGKEDEEGELYDRDVSGRGDG
jgi:hypothetical protein